MASLRARTTARPSFQNDTMNADKTNYDLLYNPRLVVKGYREIFGAPANRLCLCGHSAGGHLAAMMLSCRWRDYSPSLPSKVVSAAMSISGLYDLTEIVRVHSVNCDVHLDERSALKVSPAFLPPATDAPLYTAVGGEENQGFHIQNRLIGEKWAKVRETDIPCPGKNHFTVLDQFCDPESGLFKAILEMMDV